MKSLLTLSILSLAVASTAGGFRMNSSSSHGEVTYGFEARSGQACNLWDSASKPIPLSPKRARDIGAEFMKRVPVEAGWEWAPFDTSLRQISARPEEWVYVINFDIVQAKTNTGFFRGSTPSKFNVIINLDGTIPATKIDTTIIEQ